MLNHLQERKVFPNVQDQTIRVGETGSYRNFFLLKPSEKLEWVMLAHEDTSPMLLLQSQNLRLARLRPGTMSTILHPPTPLVWAKEHFSQLPGDHTLQGVHGPTYPDYNEVIRTLEKSWWKKRTIQMTAKITVSSQGTSWPFVKENLIPWLQCQRVEAE